MKFDVVIGNPPFQNNNDSRNADDSIYNEFMERAYKLGKKVMLVTPGRFLFNAGNTPKEWNEKMLNDEHLKVVRYEPKSKVFFPETDIKGGVAITYRDEDIKFGKIGTFVIYKELNEILLKVKEKENRFLTDITFTAESYRFTDAMYKDFPYIENMLSEGHKYDIASNTFEKLLNIVFFDEEPLDSLEYIKVYGRTKEERKFRWIKKEYIFNEKNLYNYKVFLPAAFGSGELGESITNPIVVGHKIGHTQTFISMGSFETKQEAENLLKYIKTKFSRVLLGVLKVTQNAKRGVYGNIPLQDFTDNSDIDWSKSISEIDQQLYKKYELSDEEIEFIEKNVKSMEDKVVE